MKLYSKINKEGVSIINRTLVKINRYQNLANVLSKKSKKLIIKLEHIKKNQLNKKIWWLNRLSNLKVLYKIYPMKENYLSNSLATLTAWFSRKIQVYSILEKKYYESRKY